MIRHNIIFKAKSGVSDEQIAQAINDFCMHDRDLKNVFSMMGGECHMHDEKSTNFFMHDIARGATHCISIDFTNRQALEDFFNNPALLAAKESIVAIAEGGYEGIVAFDLENPSI